MNRTIQAVALCATLPLPVIAGTYTWIPGLGNVWDFATANWDDGTTAGVVWQDGNDAVIDSGSDARTIAVSGNPSAANLTTSGGKEIKLTGSGASLSITGTVTPLTKTTISVPISGANALVLVGDPSTQRALTLDAENTYSGGTRLTGDSTTSPLLDLTKGDASLGAVPATPQDNIFIDSKYWTLFPSKPLSIDANRQIFVSNDSWLRFRPKSDATVTVNGRIHGETTGGLDYPTNTHFLVQQNNKGTVVLNSGAAVTNDLGTLSVRGKLIVSNGVYRLSSGIANAIDGYRDNNNGTAGSGGTSLGFVRGGNGGTVHSEAYDAAYGHLVVDGGEIITPEAELAVPLSTDADANRCFVAMEYANVEIRSKATMPNVKYLNGQDTPATLTIGDGADVTLASLQVSGNTTESVVNICTGGVLRLIAFSIVNPGSGKQAYPCTVNLDGGEIHRMDVVTASGSANELTTADRFMGDGSWRWTNTTFSVKAGGAIFVTDGGRAAFTRVPLKSGVASGETDGGLTVRGTKEFVFSVAGSDYNGPTRIEGAQLMQCRVANALPSITTVQLASGASIGFNTYSGEKPDVAQTVARIEGAGEVRLNSLLTVTGGIAPVFDNAYGTLTFKKACSLGGSLDITGDANGCGCVKFDDTAAQGGVQSIANLTLRMVNPAGFATGRGKTFYKVIDGEYAGRFAATDLRGDWDVFYASKAVYLRHIDATMISVR